MGLLASLTSYGVLILVLMDNQNTSCCRTSEHNVYRLNPCSNG